MKLIATFAILLSFDSAAYAACDKTQLQTLQTAGYSVAEALAWCAQPSGVNVKDASGGAPSKADAPQSKSGTPSPVTSPGTTGAAPATTAEAPTVAPDKSKAADAAASSNSSQTPYSGASGTVVASIFTRTRVPGFKAVDVPNAPIFTAPAHIFFNENVRPDGSGNAYGYFAIDRFTPGAIISAQSDKNCVDPRLHFYQLWFMNCVWDSANTTEDDQKTTYLIDTGTEYTVPVAELDKYGVNSYGVTYGLLTAPYKYHLSDRSFGSSASLGPYVGFLASDSGYTTKYVASVGITSVAVGTGKSGSTATTSKSAISLSTGFLVDITNNFEIGALVGLDEIGPNSGYQYNGKPWVAFDIGVKFGN